MIDFSLGDAPTDMDDLPRDSVPVTSEVEYPCKNCGREAGPYGGRGRKPTVCVDCKPKRNGNKSAVKVNGTTANLAAQATQVLCQLNGFMAMGLAAMRMFGTAGAIGAYDETFREQAYNALLVDPELCKYLLRGGAKSGKVALVAAYGMMAVNVAPVAMEEMKELRAQREARREQESL